MEKIFSEPSPSSIEVRIMDALLDEPAQDWQLELKRKCKQYFDENLLRRRLFRRQDTIKEQGS